MKKTLLLAMLMVIVPSLALLSLSVYIQSRSQIHTDYQLLRNQSEDTLVRMLEMVDSSYMMLERSLDSQMRQGFEIFLEAYQGAGGNPAAMDLEAVQDSLASPMDLYVINAQGIVIATTYRKDLGLDFRKYPDFYRTITEYRKGDSYCADRLTPEIQTGTIRRYAYHPTPDHRYLLELGLVSEAFRPYMGKLDPTAYTRELEKLNPALLSVQLIDENSNILGKFTDAGEPQKADRPKLVQRLFSDPDFTHCQETDPETGNLIQHLFVNLESEEFATDKSRVARLVYSPEPRRKAVGRIIRQQMLISLFILAAALLFAALLARKLSGPIHRIVEDVDQIAQGDLKHQVQETSRNELIILEQSINTMKKTILDYMNRARASEQRLRENNEHLEELVQERSRQLIESEKMAATSHLVMGIAHEINTPVGVGVTAASYLTDRVTEFREKLTGGNLSRSDMDSFLAALEDTNSLILRNLEKAGNLVRRFKQISAAAEGQDSLSEINLREYTSTLLHTLEETVNRANLRVEQEIPADLSLRTYPRALGQVLTQLIQNTLDHAAPHTENPQLLIRAEEREEAEEEEGEGEGEGKQRQVRILLEDNGPGIPREPLKHIYEPFFTTDRSHHPGLGLHIVYNTVVQRMGGTITADVPDRAKAILEGSPAADSMHRELAPDVPLHGGTLIILTLPDIIQES